MIEEDWHDLTAIKELVLVLDWRRPLHVVIVVDDGAQVERLDGVRAGSGPMVSRFSKETSMKGCADCGNGQRCPELRAKVAEADGRTALVLGVPVEVCDACEQVWLSFEVAKRLDEMFTSMLESDVELATRHFDAPRSSAA